MKRSFIVAGLPIPIEPKVPSLATLYSAIVGFRQGEVGDRIWIFPEAASGSARILVGVLTLALLTGLALWLSVSARNSTRHSSRFLIPQGYTGWIRVEFEAQGASPLPMQDGEFV